MKKSKFSESQIVAILKEGEAGVAAGCAQIGTDGQAIGNFAEMIIPEMRSLVRTNEEQRLLGALEAVRDIYIELVRAVQRRKQGEGLILSPALSQGRE